MSGRWRPSERDSVEYVACVYRVLPVACPTTPLRVKLLKNKGYGGADRFRSGDVLLAKPVLSRLSYGPV